MRHLKAISKDPAFNQDVKKKPLPRWYKYRLVEVKIYALCLDDQSIGASLLTPKYMLSRLNGSELQRHNDFLNANRKFRALLCNILMAQRANRNLKEALLPIRMPPPKTIKESQMIELVRAAVKHHLQTSKSLLPVLTFV